MSTPQAVGSNTSSFLTLDSVVRSYIHERGMVWHDYLKTLALAISGVRDIARDVNIGTNVKAIEVQVDETGTALFPVDSIEPIKICIENGDKIVPLSMTDDINPIPKVIDGEVVKRSRETQFLGQEVSFLDMSYYFASRINNKGENVGRMFGTPQNPHHNYQLFDDRIVFDARLNLTCIFLVYRTSGISITSANMVHPDSDEAIKHYIDSRTSFTNKGIWEKQNDRRYYTNEKRLLYGRIHGIKWEDYMLTIRRNQVLAPKY